LGLAHEAYSFCRTSQVAYELGPFEHIEHFQQADPGSFHLFGKFGDIGCEWDRCGNDIQEFFEFGLCTDFDTPGLWQVVVNDDNLSLCT
jgi:hypothetical protein